MRHSLRVLAVAVVFSILSTGCSYRIPFELQMTVVDAQDGSPVEGVSATLDTDPGTPGDWAHGTGDLPKTDREGKSTREFEIQRPLRDCEEWNVTFDKAGYEVVVVHIKPGSVPKDGQRVPIPVVVSMKRLPETPIEK